MGNVYLGKRVRDIREKGLDSPSEVYGIVREILEDYRSGAISYKTAMSRLNLLELVIQKDSKFSPAQKRKLRRYVDRAREKLKSLRRRKRRTVKVEPLPTFQLPAFQLPRIGVW